MPPIRTSDFPIDFARLELTPKPNQALALPAGFAGKAEPHLGSPDYPVPAEALQAVVEQVLAEEKLVRILQLDQGLRQLRVVARTAVLRFPDDIWIQIVPRGSSRSALAIYSRSRFGYSDLGVNRRRVGRWLAAIAARLLR
jgi:uncharacterized protein (DUF1499 family)